jgi:hypothetical protein
MTFVIAGTPFAFSPSSPATSSASLSPFCGHQRGPMSGFRSADWNRFWAFALSTSTSWPTSS